MDTSVRHLALSVVFFTRKTAPIPLYPVLSSTSMSSSYSNPYAVDCACVMHDILGSCRPFRGHLRQAPCPGVPRFDRGGGARHVPQDHDGRRPGTGGGEGCGCGGTKWRRCPRGFRGRRLWFRGQRHPRVLLDDDGAPGEGFCLDVGGERFRGGWDA